MGGRKPSNQSIIQLKIIVLEAPGHLYEMVLTLERRVKYKFKNLSKVMDISLSLIETKSKNGKYEPVRETDSLC
jgi:hypothetical protein